MSMLLGVEYSFHFKAIHGTYRQQRNVFSQFLQNNSQLQIACVCLCTLFTHFDKSVCRMYANLKYQNKIKKTKTIMLLLLI